MSESADYSSHTSIELGRSELLGRLASFLTPDNLGELTADLRAMHDCGVQGIDFEERHRLTRRGLFGKEIDILGKTTTKVGTSIFIFSDLCEVEWITPQEDGKQVIVQASADFSGNNHPRLLITEGHPGFRGTVARSCTLRELQTQKWLSQFLYELALVDSDAYQFHHGRRPEREYPDQEYYFDGLWQLRNS